MITTTKTFYLQEELGNGGNFEKLTNENLKSSIEEYVANDTVATIWKWEHEVDFPELGRWLTENGVTRDESVIFVFNQF
jgi:hypothetical protein